MILFTQRIPHLIVKIKEIIMQVLQVDCVIKLPLDLEAVITSVADEVSKQHVVKFLENVDANFIGVVTLSVISVKTKF